MDIKREDLEHAVSQGILQQAQLEPLLVFLNQRRNKPGNPDQPRFTGTHVLYYLGGLLAISAASLFATLAVEAMGVTALFVLTILYAACAIVAAGWFEKHNLGIPASIFATLAIALTPLAIYALQHIFQFWDADGNAQHYRDYHRWIDWRWIVMELSTILSGALMLKRFHYPFLVLPIALTLWYLGMDVVPALLLQTGVDNTDWFSGATWELRKKITLVFGLLMLLFAFVVDLRSRYSKDYAFWLYLFGLLTFWGALSSMGTGELSGKLVYLLLNFGLIFIGVILARRTFAVFGGTGILMVLGDMSWHMFNDSFSFMLVLTAIGFAFIGVGVWWGKHEASVSAKFRSVLPQDLRELLESRALS